MCWCSPRKKETEFSHVHNHQCHLQDSGPLFTPSSSIGSLELSPTQQTRSPTTNSPTPSNTPLHQGAQSSHRTGHCIQPLFHHMHLLHLRQILSLVLSHLSTHLGLGTSRCLAHPHPLPLQLTQTPTQRVSQHFPNLYIAARIQRVILLHWSASAGAGALALPPYWVSERAHTHTQT